ncbi:MAG: hypothetical protein AABW89_01165 [Nanoarchaeota archaeon]
MKKLVLFLIVVNLAIVSAEIEQTPYTPEIITAIDPTVIPVSFFNEGKEAQYKAVIKEESSLVKLEYSSINVKENEFGSFNLLIGENNPEEGIYFNSMSIYKDEELFQKIPIIIAIESKKPYYDLSIKLDQSSDVSFIGTSSEVIISPTITVYKLNYNIRTPSSTALRFFVYSLEGKLLYSSEEVISVSRQSSFEILANIGADYPEEVIVYVEALSNPSGSEQTLGLDLYQLSLEDKLLLSPPLEINDYSSKIYFGIFLFLLCSIILISYLWHNKSVEQAKGWKSRLNEIKNTNFGEAAKSLRKLKDQKDTLERAYSNHYISKNSFDTAMKEISKLANQLKKRL